jgi:hypothetical protein
MLIVDEQGCLRNPRLLEEAGERFTNERMPSVGAHQTINSHFGFSDTGH